MRRGDGRAFIIVGSRWHEWASRGRRMKVGSQDNMASAEAGRLAVIEAAATALQEAWANGQPCPPVRHLLPSGDLAAAYAVQNIMTERRLADSRRLVGRKIGLTSIAVQKQLGVDQPDYGMLFDDMDVALGNAIAWSRVHQPKVEAEVAFIMGKDLDDERLTSADILASVDYAVAAIEIVGSRIANWDIQIVDTIADNASADLFVVGHEVRRLDQIDIASVTMTMKRRNEVVSKGEGAACMGSPLSALLWLAKTCARLGRPLRCGDLVLSGALGPMSIAAPGDLFEARIDPLGSVRIEFGEVENHDS
jgi:2-keto-4-pentenoate hydratase